MTRQKDGEKLRLLIVGEAPGAREEETGELFSGAAGQYLSRKLEELGLKREWFFVTNAVKCRPLDNRTPTAKEIKTCASAYLRHEVQEVAPQYGLALGNGGLQATLGKKGITKANGTTYEAMGVTWVAAFHPAAVLRNPRNEKAFVQALLVFARLVRNEEGVPVTESILVNDKETLRQLIEDMKGAKVGSLDVETWSSHPGVGRFKGGGLAWWHRDFQLATLNFSFRPGRSYVLPVFHREAKWRDPSKVLRLLAPHMEAVPTWIMHNGKYDSKCMEVSGVSIRHGFDTMGAAYALDENNLKDLGFMSQVYLGAPDYKEMVDKSKMLTEPLDKMVEYGGADSDYTLRLYPIMKRQLKGSLAERLYYKLLHPADLCLTDVELRGVPLDQDKLWERSHETDQKVREIVKGMEEIVGHKFNPNSPQQVGQVLYGELGFPVMKRTGKGAPSTDESVLLRLLDLEDGPGIIQAMLDYRHWSGYQSRYFKPWPILMDDDGRLHTHFKPYHTVTGRLSSEHPNLQQVPRDPFVRGIIGGRPGWTIIEADYSQVELRIVAHYSQDKAMLRAYHAGRDIHMETAMAVTGLSEAEIDSETRKKAKAVNFGFVYGMGAPKFQEYARDNYGIKVTMDEAKQTRRDYFDLFRSLPKWHARQRSAAKRRGWVVSAIGRKRHLHDIRSTNEQIRAEAERQAINSPVQSLASDMMLMAMTEFNRRGYKNVRVICTVHDSIMFECRDEYVDKAIPVIKRVMEDYVLETMEKEFEARLTVPIVADIKVGSHWSEGATEL